MPKPQYSQKFRHVWMKDPALESWLTVVESTAGPQAKCKLCSKIINNKYVDLTRHGISKKHLEQKNIVFGKSQQKIPFKKVEELIEEKRAEANLALYAVCHTSINAIDHLNNICKTSFKSCHAGSNLQIHRTKCSNIIKNVLYPHFKSELINDLHNQHFSLLIDESTDISVQKYLGIVVIYYSNTQNSIITTYLDMPLLTEFNAVSIAEAIKETINKHKLKLNLLMGIGCDNASVMVGVNNGVYAILKKENPNLVLVRCVCHSLQLAVSAAASKNLPRNLEFLIRETYDWFARSCSRQLQYKNLYCAINEGQEPLKIVQACQTRWLSIETAVTRILNQWLELRTHFNIAQHTERCFTARSLSDMFSDDTNFALLCFIKSILSEVQRVNKLFESADADPTKLHLELIGLIKTLIAKITLPGHNNLNIFTDKLEDYIDRKCYLGYNFEKTIRKLLDEKLLTRPAEENLRGRAISFVVDLILELKKRLPKNLETMKSVAVLSVENALSHNKQSLLPLLNFSNKSDNDIEIIENMWAKVHLFEWKNTKHTNKFWCEVVNFKDAGGENPFLKLAEFALSFLVLPYSNAEVERLFSQLNIIKTKLRNRLGVGMVNAILTIKQGLRRQKKCCDSYMLPENVLKKIKTNETYSFTLNEDEEGFDLMDMVNVLA